MLGAAAAAAFVLVVTADVANPEAFVARHNLTRAAAGAELDPAYLSELSDDAVPAVAVAWDEADAEGRAELRPALRCDEDPTGASALNLAVQRADAIRATPLRRAQRGLTVPDPRSRWRTAADP